MILAPDIDSEGRFIQNSTSCCEPLDKGRWRLWYSINGPDKPFNICVAEGIPGEPMDKHHAVLTSGEPEDAPLSIGNLPDGWRPVQGVHLQLPDGRHRLYFWVHGPGVARYLAAHSTDGRRYRVIDPGKPCLYQPNDRAAVISEESRILGLTPSVEGVHKRPENEQAAPGHLICNDATTVYQLPDGSFELYSPGLVPVGKDDPAYVAHDSAAGLVRVIDRWTSEDGLNWENRTRVIQCDENDPADMQFYHLSVTHTDKGRVGLLGHYRVEAQTMDLEWCFSADGVKWERPLRQGWLPRGEGNAPDCYGIYPPRNLVYHDGKWWLFYTGVNVGHNLKDSRGEPRGCVMLATVDSIWK